VSKYKYLLHHAAISANIFYYIRVVRHSPPSSMVSLAQQLTTGHRTAYNEGTSIKLDWDIHILQFHSVIWRVAYSRCYCWKLERDKQSWLNTNLAG